MENSSQPKTNKDWEELARVDALWAILSSPKKEYGKWDVEEFFGRGQKEVAEVTEYLKSRGIKPGFGKILDFGCGAGRLAGGFSGLCQRYYGVDASPSMLKLARKYNEKFTNCEFLLNVENNLSIFGDNFFDLVYSNIVLQHIPTKDSRRYISEFIRILKPGGYLYFQLPSYIPPIHRIQPRRRLYAIMRRLGLSSEFLWQRMKIMPIRMMSLPSDEIARIIGKDAKIFDIRFPKAYGTKYLIQKTK